MISFLVIVFTFSAIKFSTSSSLEKNILENALLYFAHIYSTGFSSGQYGWRKSKTIFSGIINFFALWNRPLSSTKTLSSFGFSFDISSKNIWKFSELQWGKINSKCAPVIGEYAPNSQVDLNTCWNLQIGLTPIAVRDFPFLVNNPKRASSSKNRLIESKCPTVLSAIFWQIWPKFF